MPTTVDLERLRSTLTALLVEAMAKPPRAADRRAVAAERAGDIVRSLRDDADTTVAAPVPHLITLTDMVTMFGVGEQTPYHWRMRGNLPEPLLTFGKSAVWLYSDIVAWAEATGRAIVSPLDPPVAYTAAG